MLAEHMKGIIHKGDRATSESSSVQKQAIDIVIANAKERIRQTLQTKREQEELLKKEEEKEKEPNLKNILESRGQKKSKKKANKKKETPPEQNTMVASPKQEHIVEPKTFLKKEQITEQKTFSKKEQKRYLKKNLQVQKNVHNLNQKCRTPVQRN